MPTDPRAPDRDTWRRLLPPALTVIDSLRTNGYGDLDPDAAVAALRATRRTRPALLRQLDRMGVATPEVLMRGILLTEPGRRYADGMLGRLRAAIAAVDRDG